MSAMFALAQTNFRFYEDGTESGSTAIDAQNTNITRTVASNSALHLRVMLDETGGVAGASTDDYQLQKSVNAGAYANVNTVSTGVRYYASASLTDAGATTSRLTGGTGSHLGEISEDGLVDDLAVPSGGYSELLYSIELIAADLANNDTIDFRVLRNGATFTYSVTPRITVSKPSNATLEPGLVTNTQTFHAATVTTGAVTLSPSLVTNTQTFYGPTVTAGGAEQTLTPSLVTNGQTFYGPTVARGAVTLSPSLVSNSQTFHAATVSASITLTASLLTNSQTFYAPTVSQPGAPAQTLSPSLVSNSQSFPTPTVSASNTLTPTLLSSGGAFYLPSVIGPQSLTPSLLSNTEAFFVPTVALTGWSGCVDAVATWTQAGTSGAFDGDIFDLDIFDGSITFGAPTRAAPNWN